MPQEDRRPSGRPKKRAILRIRRICGPTDENSPECVSRPKRAGKESYLYGWGPNEYVPTGSRWELLEGARHMCFVDRHEDYCRILESWLEEQDGRY